MKPALVFTNDWELFGDGSGDYFELQHKPLRNLLDVFEERGARLSVMAEVGQQWAHRNLAATHAWSGRIADAWEHCLRETVARGHDVQLHLHPQWLGAAWHTDGWQVDMEKWSVGSLTGDELKDVLVDGKQYLESLLRPVRPGYVCHCFRAGGFCVEPSAGVVKALLQADFTCDTSIVKGFRHRRFYDFRDAHSNVMPWPVSMTSLKYRGSEGALLEIPVTSVRQWYGRLAKCRRSNPERPFESEEERAWFKRRREFLKSRYPHSRRPSKGAQDLSSAVRLRIPGLLHGSWKMLDYDNMSVGRFVDSLTRVVSRAAAAARKTKVNHVPIVAIGHTKASHNAEQVSRLLDQLDRHFGADWLSPTLSEAATAWRENLANAKREPRK